ncbi:MAG TPA: portal protein [Thermoleophilia bacterium]|nr:portal protein [Thermoleophilia bacterium]
MAKEREMRESFGSMVFHPWSNLRKIQGLDRLPDRRVSKHKEHPADYDPLRGAGASQAIYKALGLYAQEESRVELYENYREMDYDSIISGVLDAFGEDATQIDAETGRVTWVSSTNADIQQIVMRCLDRTHQESQAFPTCRQLGRDGDVWKHVAAARGDGVIALKAYDPWQVSRIEDDIGRLTGFAPADDRGNPSKGDTHSVPYYKVLHYRLPARDLTNIYGAQSSFLWGARITWRELQLMLDQVVMQRLLRRPDRLSVLVDTAGMSHDDAHYFIQDLQRRMHREWHLNPGGGGLLGGGNQFQSSGFPIDGGFDFVLPKGPQNNTSIENFPATNQNDLLRDVDMMFRQLANGIGFPHGFMGSVEGRYNPEQSLSRQHQPFAKRASRLQRAFLHETVRLCMIDMAFQGLDPTKEEHQFSLHMAPVSPILEMERHEMLQMKIDRLERALRMGMDNQFDLGFWVPFVLRTYGGFPDETIAAMYPGEKGADGAGQAVGSDSFAFEGNGKNGKAIPNRQVLEEAIAHTLGPDPGRNQKLEAGTSDIVAEGSWDPEAGRSSMSLTEWRNSNKASRKAAVADNLQDTLEPTTRIQPLNDGQAREFRKRIQESRAAVARNLVMNGKIFNLKGARGR